MLGKRKAQRDLFDVGHVFPVALDPASFHGQLAVAADRLFRDEDVAAFSAEGVGRSSTPPALLALMTLLQHEGGCSDLEAVRRTADDLRWAAIMQRAAGVPLCAKSTFPLFRAPLILHDGVRLVFEPSIAAARRAGLLKGGALRVALDTKPILERGPGLVRPGGQKPIPHRDRHRRAPLAASRRRRPDRGPRPGGAGSGGAAL